MKEFKKYYLDTSSNSRQSITIEHKGAIKEECGAAYSEAGNSASR